jgi:integrase
MDTRMPAFGIRVGKHRRTWVVLREPNRTKVTIGHYPALSLQDARRLAMVTLGSAPAPVVKEIAFPAAVELFLAQPRWRESSKRVITSSLRHFTWKRSIAKITHEDVTNALNAIVGDSARAHALKDIRTFFNWCVPRYLPSSPCAGFKMQSQPSRDRVLTREELVRVWNSSADLGTFGLIVRLLILTGQRKTEIGGLQWAEVKGDHIDLPPERTKNGRAHSVPLGPLAQSLLPKRRAGFVFTATGSGDVYNGYAYHLAQLQTLSETSDWTLHDVRRTFATHLAIAGTPIHVTEKILNHVSGTLSGVAAIYNRHSYADEMRAAVETWEATLLQMAKGHAERPAPDARKHLSRVA